ncbi:galactose mutarotase, partial [Enterococcus lactis]
PLGAESIRIGVKENTAGNAFDFQTPKKLASVFASDFDHKELGDGIDHPFFLKESRLDKEAARVTSRDKKIQVVIATDAS